MHEPGAVAQVMYLGFSAPPERDVAEGWRWGVTLMRLGWEKKRQSHLYLLMESRTSSFLVH